MSNILSQQKIESAMGKLIPGGDVWCCSMSSEILGCEKTFTVYLPEGYEDSGRRYPVLYLLHHAGGTDRTWTETGQLRQIMDDAIRSGMIQPMIVVLPDASGENEHHLGRHMGFFSVQGWDYEAYFHKELIPLVDATYRTIADRGHRAIAGPSMGGECAVAYAQRYPEFYGAAGSMSGILGKPEQSTMARSDKDYGDSLIRNNPTAFVENATAEEVERLKSTRWYADCGDNDFFCEGNVAFFLAMRSRGVALDYRMRSGVHGFYYWITGLAPLLQFISAGFGVASAQ